MTDIWREIQDEFETMQRMSCVPKNIHKVPAGYIFDEEKSVKWNREQVDANNAVYIKEVARLNTLRNTERDRIYEEIYTAIRQEVGHNLSRKKAIVIWNLAYDWGHSGGIMEICNYLDELMELAEKLLEKEETANGRKQ